MCQFDTCVAHGSPLGYPRRRSPGHMELAIVRTAVRGLRLRRMAPVVSNHPRYAVFLILLILVAAATLRAANGTADVNFSANLGSGFDGSVESLLIQPDGGVVVTGAFSHINAITSAGVARLNPDGTPDAAFSRRLSVPSVGGSVSSSALQPDGKILVGGIFGLENLPHNFLMRLNADGTTDTAFSTVLDAQSGLDGPVSAIALQTDGKIVVSDGSLGTHIVRLNADGSGDAA